MWSFLKKWGECKKQRKSGEWHSQKIYNDKKTGKQVEIAVVINAKRFGDNVTSYCRSVVTDINEIQKYNIPIHSSLKPKITDGIFVLNVIRLNITPFDHSEKDSEITQKNAYSYMIATLEHEVTHISQKINGMLNYFDKQKYTSNYKKAGGHAQRLYEKEATLVELFSLLKNSGTVRAANFFIRFPLYFINTHMDYKTFLKKAADYGLTNSDIFTFKQYMYNVHKMDLEKIFHR